MDEEREEMVLIGTSASNNSGRTQYFGECIFFLGAGQNINAIQQPVPPQLSLRVTAPGSDSGNVSIPVGNLLTGLRGL